MERNIFVREQIPNDRLLVNVVVKEYATRVDNWLEFMYLHMWHSHNGDRSSGFTRWKL